jgi:hypothetical protein
MRFVLDGQQRLFGQTMDKLLGAADTPEVIRAWAAGSPAAGRGLWDSLAEIGLFEAARLPVEMAVAAVELGRHAVPGPYVEAFVAAALTGEEALVSGETMATVAVGGLALDADAADVVFEIDGTGLYEAMPTGDALESLDPARRLFRVRRGRRVADATAGPDLGSLACAAQLLGLGRSLLDTSVAYVKTRRQFGRPVGEYQAVKHQLADVLVELEFARPLVYGAAVTGSPRDISAAKAAAATAAYRAARVALQVHGAIGYTDEYAVGLWIRKVRALYSAWGTPSWHRARVLAA